MYSTNHRNPTPPSSSLSSISDTSPGLVKLIASTLLYHLFSDFSTSNSLVSALPNIKITLYPSSIPWCAQSSLLYAIYLTPNTSSRSGSSVVPRRWTHTHTRSLFLIYHTLCYTVLAYSLCYSLCSRYACICSRIKTVNNTYVSRNLQFTHHIRTSLTSIPLHGQLNYYLQLSICKRNDRSQ